MKGYKSKLTNDIISKEKAPPLGYAFMCLKGAIYNNTNYFKGPESLVYLRKSVEMFKKSSKLVPKNNIITRRYLMAGEPLLIKAENILDKVVCINKLKNKV